MANLISPLRMSRPGMGILTLAAVLGISIFTAPTAAAEELRPIRVATQVNKPAAAPAKAPVPAAPTLAPADAGKKIFRQCAACHSVAAGQHLIGPSLHGVFTRKAGSAPNFKYSTAMKKSAIVWNEAAFLDYIADPRKKVPGTTMAFVGIRKPEDRATLYAYLKSATK